MDILKEYEQDCLRCAFGEMSHGAMVLKWSGDKHMELINTEGFSPSYNPDDCLKTVMQRRLINQQTKKTKEKKVQKISGGYNT